jgi:hypothetical protein
MSIDADIPQVPRARVTIMGEDVWEALDRFGVGDDILDEVLGVLKEIPPSQRVAYLEAMFDGLDLFDDDE